MPADTNSLPRLFVEPVKSGRLKAPQELPYAQVACEPAGAERFTGGSRIDRRKVTITVRGTKGQVTQALAAVLAVFNETTTLAYPSEARFLLWWPLDDGKLEQDEGTHQGEDIWKGTVTAEVKSVRRRPLNN